MSKVHTLVIVRRGLVQTQFTANTVEELEDYLLTSMKGHLKNAIYYGQEKFYQGETKYNLLYSCWDVMI